MATPLVFRSPIQTNDTSLPILRRDPLLKDDNNGVRFAFDLAFGWSYAGGAPTNGAVVKDIAEKANSQARVAGGQSVSFAGGGFDFSACTAPGQYVEVPSSVASDIWGNGTDPQYYLICAYVKLPATADWVTSGNVAPIVSFYDGGNDSMCQITMGYSGQALLNFQRNLNGSTPDDVSLGGITAHQGKVAQVAIWRNAAGRGLRVKSDAGATSATGTVSSSVTLNFSDNVGKFGMYNSPLNTNWANAIAAGAHPERFRLYRGFVENLRTSGRNPTTVLDADYARVTARGVFS